MTVTHRSFAEQSRKYFLRDRASIPNAPVDSPAAWHGADLAAREQEWRRPFAPAELDELEAVLDAIEAESADLATLDPKARSLPLLETAAAAWRAELGRGRGFLVLTGLPVTRWSESRSSLAFWLLGHLIGIPGAQNAANELLGHVIDYGEQKDTPNVRLYRTASPIGFHCDAADVVGLLCLETAAKGGASRIASSVAIWNVLVRERPDLARLLFEPVPVDRRGEHGPEDKPFYFMRPCCYGADGVLRTFYHGEYFRSVARLDEVGPLPSDRAEALDRYDAIGASDRFRLDMQLERGDIQLLSNHTVVHARTDYEDAPDRKRHLLRLWLSLPE